MSISTKEASETDPAASEAPDPLNRRFNDDLLSSDADRKRAKMLYPKIFHALDFPRLRAEFKKYDAIANSQKRWLHVFGLCAILFAGAALGFSAANPIVNGLSDMPTLSDSLKRQVHAFHSASVWMEICGLLGSIVAILGLWLSKFKRRWLQARCMTEKLRSWHFQTLVYRCREIVASFTPGAARAAFVAERERWFDKFLSEHEGKLDSKLTELVESAGAYHDTYHPRFVEIPPESPALLELLAAYLSLRLKHQEDFAAHKVRSDSEQPFWKFHRWPSRLLDRRLGSVTTFATGGALVVSFYIVLAHFLEWPFAESGMLPAMILCLLVLNVAARAIQDGLAVKEELERYIDYGDEVRHLRFRFEESPHIAEQLSVAREMERAAGAELRSFLRAHQDARFVL